MPPYTSLILTVKEVAAPPLSEGGEGDHFWGGRTTFTEGRTTFTTFTSGLVNAALFTSGLGWLGPLFTSGLGRLGPLFYLRVIRGEGHIYLPGY